jgi:hypothetical protein
LGAWASDELPDPTRPPLATPGPRAAPADDAKSLDLRAIFISDDRRVALINDQRVRERDQIGSARVVRIDYDGVQLQRNGEAFELELIARDVKQNRRPVQAAPVVDSKPEKGNVE